MICLPVFFLSFCPVAWPAASCSPGKTDWLLDWLKQILSVSVSVPVRQRIQMTGDENGVGGRVRCLAYWLVVIGVFDFGFEGRNGL